MIVVRDGFKERLEEKTFGIHSASEIIDVPLKLERMPLELMKLLEMHSYKGGYLIHHWSTKPISDLSDTQRFRSLAEIFYIFQVNSFSELSGILKDDEIDTLIDQYGAPDTLIDHIRYRMLNERSTSINGPKYQNMWFVSHKPEIDNDTFRLMMKYLSLIYTGQVDKGNFLDFWEDINSIKRMKINFKINPHVSDNMLRELIVYVVSAYAGTDYTDKI